MIPKRVSLGSIVYDIELVDGLLDDERSKKLNGQISINDATIRIEEKSNPQTQAMVLFHEIVHHIMMVTGHESDVRPDVAESFIDALSGGFLATLRLNPDLIKFIGELDDRRKGQ